MWICWVYDFSLIIFHIYQSPWALVDFRWYDNFLWFNYQIRGYDNPMKFCYIQDYEIILENRERWWNYVEEGTKENANGLAIHMISLLLNISDLYWSIMSKLKFNLEYSGNNPSNENYRYNQAKANSAYLNNSASSFKARALALLFMSTSSGSSFICFLEYTQTRFLNQPSTKIWFTYTS